MEIREFQEMMRRIYYHRDSRRGVKGTYDWLVDETRELGEAIEGGSREALRDEVADVFAWLASLANLLGVNLEDAALSKYSNRCPRCGKPICECEGL